MDSGNCWARPHGRSHETATGVGSAVYFSGGPLFTVPLKFIPADFGSWSLRAGVQFLVLNTNLKTVNTDDGFVPIGNVGLTLTY
jgi:hypothetical protein